MDVAVYCRVSSDEQAERGTIDNQRVYADKYVKLRDLSVYDYYIDDGVSGMLPLAERPEGSRLLDDARHGCFKMVLFYKIDRLGRTTKNIVDAVDALKKYNVGISSMTEPFDTSTPAGEFMMTTFAGIAQMDRANILERMRQGMINNVKRGKWMAGEPPYGYKLVEGYPQPDTKPIDGLPYSPADVVKMIFDWVVDDHMTGREIAKKLNALGVPPKYKLTKRKTHHKGVWYSNKVIDIVHNTVYYGYHAFGKSAGYCIDQAIPPIVDKPLWDEAQKQVALNRLIPAIPSDRRVNLLRSLIRCENCGRTLTVKIGKLRNGTSVYYYTCHASKIKATCISRSLRADKIEPLVWQRCLSYIGNPSRIITKAEKRYDRDAITREIVVLNKRLEELNRDKQTAISLCIKGIVTEDDLKSSLDDIARQIKDCQRLLKDKTREINIKSEQCTEMVEYCKTLQNKIKNNLSRVEQREIINKLVKGVYVKTSRTSGDMLSVKVRIEFKFPAVDRLGVGGRDPQGQAYGTQPPTAKTVAESLRYHRLRMHLSITALATLAGLSRDAIAKIEHGRFGLRRANAISLANVLGITPRELLAVDAMPETTLSERFYKAKAINVHEWPDVSKIIGVSARTIRDYVEGRRHQNGAQPAFGVALKKYIEDALKS